MKAARHKCTSGCLSGGKMPGKMPSAETDESRREVRLRNTLLTERRLPKKQDRKREGAQQVKRPTYAESDASARA